MRLKRRSSSRRASSRSRGGRLAREWGGAGGGREGKREVSPPTHPTRL